MLKNNIEIHIESQIAPLRFTIAIKRPQATQSGYRLINSAITDEDATGRTATASVQILVYESVVGTGRSLRISME